MLFAACLIALSSVAACGSDGASPAPATLTVTTSSAQVGETGPISTGGSTPPPDSTSEQRGSGETSAVKHSPVVRQAPAAERSPGIPSRLTSADANVDPHLFYNFGGQGYAYYFQSPSGNVRCGIGFPNPYTPEGCQAVESVPSPAGTRCGNDGGRTAYLSELTRGAVRIRCTSTSVYVGSDKSRELGGSVLRYGQTISASGVTCTSTTAGISCYQGEHGFTLARDRNAVY